MFNVLIYCEHMTRLLNLRVGVNNLFAIFFSYQYHVTMNLDGFTKLVINLDERTDRWKYMQEQLAIAGISNYHRLPAIKPKLIDIKEEWISNYWSTKKANYEHDRYIVGSTGCKLSHVEAVKIAKEEGKDLMVFEDDIIVRPDKMEQMWKAVEGTPWEIFYMGGQLQGTWDTDPKLKVHQARDILSTHALLIRKTVFDKILDEALPSGHEIDSYYRKEFAEKRKTSYVPIYQAVTQGGFGSEIRHQGNGEAEPKTIIVNFGSLANLTNTFSQSRYTSYLHS